MSRPRYRLARAHKRVRRTSGNLNLLSTGAGDTWMNFDTGLDIVLAAEVGDDIECGINGSSFAAANIAYLNVVTLVGGAPAGSFAATAAAPGAIGAPYGVPGWVIPSGVDAFLSGSVMKTMVAGDLSAGTVTLRLRYATNNIVTTRVINADGANWFFEFWAKNLGPADPN